MSAPSVPKIQYAAFDAMKEVASSLKAAYLTNAATAESQFNEQWWIRQSWLVDDMIQTIDNTNLSEIRAAADVFSARLRELKAGDKAA